MKKLLLVIGLLVVGGLALVYFGDEHQRYLAFDRDRDAWHRKCDLYVGQPASSPSAAACQQELAALMAYAKRQGWDR